jgi:hypothetical protein
MKFEITVAEFDNVPSRQLGSQTITSGKVYRYDCYIDDVYMTFGTWTEKQELYTVYQHFIKIVLREWKTKYKNKYTMNKITKHDMERLNPVTIISEDIQDIDLTLKKADEFIRLQKIAEDFK